MDVSFILIIGLAAIITAVTMIYAEMATHRPPVMRISFGVPYVAGLLMMQPWHIQSFEDAGIAIAMLVFMAFWVVIGIVVGGIPAAIAIAFGKHIVAAVSKQRQ